MITDGVTEAASPGAELFGRQRLESLLGQVGGAASASEVGESIRRDVGRFTEGQEPSDDLAILVLRWTGPAGS
jgi:serine phosphatase RsbU (regulator of sigma subunit)